MTRRKRINKKVLMSIFIVAIMVLSVFGFMMSYQTNQRDKLADYNGFEFSRTQHGLMTEIDGNEMYFNYYPGDLEKLSFPDDASLILADSKVFYVTYDPDSDFATAIAEQQLDMELKLNKLGDRFISKGFTNATGYELPEITCANATAAIPVYQIIDGENSSIQTEESCVILTIANEPDLNAYHTRILYTILGVMK